MKKTILAVFPFAILVVSILACAKASPEQIRKYTATPSVTMIVVLPSETITPLPVSTQTPILAVSATPDRFHDVSILATFLIVRAEPNGDPTGKELKQGDAVRVACVGSWCELEAGGFVWRGCTSDNPEKLGCRER